jgi:SAM-dependent methyltransferase
VSGFDPAWLALREPLDARSRAHGLAEALRRTLRGTEPLRILDLGTGTGSNLRYLAPRLGGRQEWVLVDADPSLLSAVPDAMRVWAGAGGFSVEPADLAVRGPGFRAEARLLRAELTRDLDRLPFDGCHLVTASALLDLVSAPWLHALTRRCASTRAALLFSLTYDGRIEIDPAAAEDGEVRRLVNLHQRTDKGFGPALGPAAADTAERLLSSLGYRVASERSDWRIGAADGRLQLALVDGWLEAAAQIAPAAAGRIRAWGRRRGRQIASGGARMRVGHRDLMAAWGPVLD